MNANEYRRRLSGIERGYLSAATLGPHPVIHLVLEAAGLVSVADVALATTAALQSNPGLGVTRRGATWVGGSPVPVTVHDWVEDLNTVEAFHDDIDVVRGPVAGIHLFSDPTTERTRLVVRASHTVTDGRGLEQFLGDIVRGLRGEPCIGSPDTTIDTDLVALADAKRRHEPIARSGADRTLTPSPLAGGRPPEAGLRWRTRHLPGARKELTGRIGAVLAEGLQQESTLIVPVNLRRHDRLVRSSANLSAQLPLPLHPGDDADQIRGRLFTQLRRNGELEALRGHYRHTNAFATTLDQALDTGRDGRYPCLAIVSDHGWFDLEDYSTPTLHPTRLYTLSMLVPYAGMFISCFSSALGCDITITHRASDEPALVDDLLDRIAAAVALIPDSGATT